MMAQWKGRALGSLVNEDSVGLVSIILSCLRLVLKPNVTITPHRAVPTDPLVFV